MFWINNSVSHHLGEEAPCYWPRDSALLLCPDCSDLQKLSTKLGGGNGTKLSFCTSYQAVFRGLSTSIDEEDG